MPWSARGISGVSTGGVRCRVKLAEMPDEPHGLMTGGCNGLAKVWYNYPP